jgi:6-pyruvoyltetrahydropterin/6-carboxytetrahydropterin synthase
MKLIIKAKFDAAHHIPEHPKCGNVHGHTYHIEIEFESDNAITPEYLENVDGMIVDFHELKDLVRRYILAYYDHKDLNTLLQLPIPTAEYIAWHIHTVLETALRNTGFDVKVVGVTVWETEECGVRYP